MIDGDDPEVDALLYSAEEGGAARERERIIGVLQDAAVDQANEGDIDGAQMIAECVRLIQMVSGMQSEHDDEVIETEVMEVGDPDPGGPDPSEPIWPDEPAGELPPDRERPDDEVMASLVRQVGRE